MPGKYRYLVAHGLLLVLATCLFVALALPSVAVASPAVVAPTSDPALDLALLIYQGIRSGEYFAAAAGALVLVTALARRFGAQVLPWLATDVGGTALVLSGSFGGSLLAAALAGSAPSLGLAWDAFVIAFAASGGYAALKRLVIEPLRPRVAGWPVLARAAFRTVAWIFDRPQTPSSRANTAPIVGVVLLVIAGAVVGCTAHQRELARAGAGAGADTALRCQSENITGLALEAYELARHYLVSTINGAGEVDTTAIRIAARQVRTDDGRCAFAAALAAVTEAMSQRKGALGIGPSPSYVLRRTLEEVARDDWQRVVELDGELVR